VEWSAKDRSVTLTKAEDKLKINYNSFSVTDKGHLYYADMKFINGKAYISEEFFNDSLGLTILRCKANESVSLKTFMKNEAAIKTVNEKTEEPRIGISLQYPKISGLDDISVENAINETIKKEAITAKQEGLEYIKNFPEDTEGNKYQVDLNYRITYNQNNLLSIVLQNYQYTGGAHGDMLQKSYTFNLQTGKEYYLQDLFKGGADYKTLFNNLVKDGIKERGLSKITQFNSVSWNQVYYLDNNGVIIYFEPYEYFARSDGIQEFSAKYDELTDMLNPGLGFEYPTERTMSAGVLNTLRGGDIGTVILKGNPTTGYSWNYTIEDDSIVNLSTESSAASRSGQYVYMEL
jgi:hypothetical protein